VFTTTHRWHWHAAEATRNVGLTAGERQEENMFVVENAKAPEVPWRPGYRYFSLAGKDQGIACVVSQAIVEPGAGAPLHVHTSDDEVLIVLDGALDVRLGDERRIVEAGHTISIPAGVPHSFVAAGGVPATFIGFLPKIGETTFLEGGPAQGADRR
jgi:quercetin dioxygenase-like cupin family protein